MPQRLPVRLSRRGAPTSTLSPDEPDTAGVAVRRVLIGDFAALQQAGYRDLLRSEGMEVVETAGRDVVDRLVEAVPDAVLLDSDDAGSPALVQRIVHQFPAVVVITCSSRSPTMRVFPPQHYGESYASPLEPTLLTDAIQS